MGKNMISSHVKRSPFPWLCSKSHPSPQKLNEINRLINSLVFSSVSIKYNVDWRHISFDRNHYREHTYWGWPESFAPEVLSTVVTGCDLILLLIIIIVIMIQ